MPKCHYLVWASLLVCQWVFAANVSVSDDAGRTVTLDRVAGRIVSLAPHATELLFAAGAGQQVVGVDSYSDYPPAAQQLPAVGSSASINIESIMALRPDLVVAWQSGNTVTQIEQLIKLGIPVFYSEPRHLEDIATNLQRLGRLAGTTATADKAAQAFRNAYRQLGRTHSQATPVRTFYQIWNRPLMTVNGEHLISQVIRLCGGTNIFAGLHSLAPAVNLEAVLAADPQVIIASGIAAERPDWLDNWRAWPRITAVRNHQLYTVDPDLIQRQTPRILDGAQLICQQLQQARDALAKSEQPSD